MIRLTGLVNLKPVHSLKEDTMDDGQPEQPVDDHEGAMAKAQLMSIHKNSGEVYNMLGDNEELEGWVQAKLTKAAEYIDAVYHHLSYEKTKPATIGNGEGAPADAEPDMMKEEMCEGEGCEELEEGKWDYPKDIRTPKKTSSDSYLGGIKQQRAKEARKAHRKSVKAKAHKQLMGGGAKVKNPKTGEEILATSAYKAGPQHPAYQAAKNALKKEIVSNLYKEINEVSPEGWEGTVKGMKKHPEIDNPWALAYYMKKKGYKSHKKEK